MKSFLFVSAVLSLFFSACATSQSRSFVAAAKRLNTFSHIQIGCRIIDYAGNLVFFAAGGDMCLFYDDGTYIMSRPGGPLTKIDKNRNIIWKTDLNVHHVLEKSRFSDDILAIGDQWENIDNRFIRFDKLLVINQNGKVQKSFGFKNYIEGYKVKYDPWEIRDAPADKSLELSHFNSFAETYETGASSPVLSGYVANDRFSKQAFFLNKDLSQITQIWDFETRAVHGLIAASSDQFIYYMNEDNKVSYPSNRDFYSRIERFDRNSGKTSVAWESRSKVLASKMGSSVQILSEDVIFIFNALCPICTFSAEKHPVAELVFLKENRSYLLQLPDSLAEGNISATLIDARKFLENQN